MTEFNKELKGKNIISAKIEMQMRKMQQNVFLFS